MNFVGHSIVTNIETREQLKALAEAVMGRHNAFQGEKYAKNVWTLCACLFDLMDKQDEEMEELRLKLKELECQK